LRKVRPRVRKIRNPVPRSFGLRPKPPCDFRGIGPRLQIHQMPREEVLRCPALRDGGRVVGIGKKGGGLSAQWRLVGDCKRCAAPRIARGRNGNEAPRGNVPSLYLISVIVMSCVIPCPCISIRQKVLILERLAHQMGRRITRRSAQRKPEANVSISFGPVSSRIAFDTIWRKSWRG
jgi:hypothetical protein